MANQKKDKPVKKTSFSFKEQVKLLKHLFGFAKKEVKLFTISILLMFLSSYLAAVLPIMIQAFISFLQGKPYEELPQVVKWLGLNSQNFLQFLPWFYLGLLTLNLLLVYFKEYTFTMASEKTVAHLRNTIYRKMGRLSLAYFNQTPNGEIVSRITNDTETIKEFWNVFLTFFDGIINATAIAIAMFSLNARLAMVFMSFLPLIILLIIGYQKISTVVYRKMRTALARVNARLAESTMGMWVIQQFNQTQRMKKEFEAINQDYVEARINMFRMNALLLMPAINLIEQIALIIVLWIFGHQVLNAKAIDIGLVYAFTAYSKSFFHPIANMLDSLSVYQDGLVAASRGAYLLELDQEVPEQELKESLGEIQGKVQVKHLNFSYDGVTDVLKDITLTAQPGQMIALVGHTGSGKSTIINLLMRFYEFNQGEILYDDHSIREYDYDNLRDHIALVQQDSFIFYGTFMDNIRMHGPYTDEEVIAAAKFTGADHFIEAMPDGYQTLLAEGGQSLSAGQKQLINIARSVIRQPKILILDEATASIDTESEQYIQTSLEKIRRQATLIVIAHRLSTIKEADKIYVLHKGEIIESGNHQELIDAGGTYLDMYRLQSMQEIK